MKLFIYDSDLGTVSEIEGTPWPGKDANGETCYENSHFKTEAEAWEAMIKDVSAGVSLSGLDVDSVRKRLRAHEERAATCCVQFARANDNYRQWMRVIAESNTAMSRHLPHQDLPASHPITQ